MYNPLEKEKKPDGMQDPLCPLMQKPGSNSFEFEQPPPLPNENPPNSSRSDLNYNCCELIVVIIMNGCLEILHFFEGPKCLDDCNCCDNCDC